MTKVIVDSTDNNDLPAEFEPLLLDWCRKSLNKENGPLLFDWKHENTEKVVKALMETPAENLKERLLAHLMKPEISYISGFEHTLLLTMCGFDYEKDAEIQVVQN